MAGDNSTGKEVIDRLREICTGRAKDIYGEILPSRISGAIETELELAEKAGVAKALLQTHDLLQLPCFTKDRYLNIGFKGSLGASFIAFLCGITPFNPAEVSRPFALYPAFYYNRPHTKIGDRTFAICLEVGRDTEHAFLSECGAEMLPEGVTICASENLTLLDRFQQETGEVCCVCEIADNWDLYREVSASLGRNSDGEYATVEDIYDKLLVSNNKPDESEMVASFVLDILGDTLFANDEEPEEDIDDDFDPGECVDDDFDPGEYFEEGDYIEDDADPGEYFEEGVDPEEHSSDDAENSDPEECRTGYEWPGVFSGKKSATKIKITCEEAYAAAVHAGCGDVKPADLAQMRKAGMNDRDIEVLKRTTHLPDRAECIAKTLEKARLRAYRIANRSFRKRDQSSRS